MTPDDPSDPSDPSDDGLTAQEGAVRRLLADARHDEPMPADVAARLDSVLARLVDDREPALAPVDPRPGVVVDLAARRRRKVLVGLVAAAAVVVVGGVGIREVVSQAGGGDSAAQTADAGEPVDRGAEAASDAPGAGSGAGALIPTVPGADQVNGGAVDVDGRLILTSSSFLADVTRLTRLDLIAPDATTSATQAGTPAASASSAPVDGTTKGVPAGGLQSLPARCLTADLGAGRLLAVTYDGAPAVLALRPPAGQSQVVDLLACGGTVVRSVTLPR